MWLRLHGLFQGVLASIALRTRRLSLTYHFSSTPNSFISALDNLKLNYHFRRSLTDYFYPLDTCPSFRLVSISPFQARQATWFWPIRHAADIPRYSSLSSLFLSLAVEP
jgi:hypothetical protein